jgi:hypothetical protein
MAGAAAASSSPTRSSFLIMAFPFAELSRRKPYSSPSFPAGARSAECREPMNTGAPERPATSVFMDGPDEPGHDGMKRISAQLNVKPEGP